MAQQLTGLVAALALIVGMWNTWTLAGLQGQIAALDAICTAQPAAAPAVAVAPPGRVPRLEVPASGGEDRRAAMIAALKERHDAGERVIDDPEIQDRLIERLQEIGERREQDRAEMVETMRDQVDRFASEEGLDGRTRDALLEELERRSEIFAATRAEVRSGDITLADALRELEARRAASDAILQRMLGPEASARLDTILREERPGGP